MLPALGGSAMRRTSVVAGLLAVLIAAQSVAFATSPATGRASTARLVGDTGFAYLYGLRAFAAVVVWNRIDPLLHDYYGDRELSEQVELLPSIRLVQILDPQFEQSYYVAAWVIAKRGDVQEGLDIARRGVENNPSSGFLRANYAQLLMVFANDLAGAREQADAVFGSDDVLYHSDTDRYEALAIFAGVYELTGDPQTAAKLRAAMDHMRENIPAESIGDHDHDGDGVQDH